MSRNDPRPFVLLDELYGDRIMSAVFSKSSSIRGWLGVEAALAEALAEAGQLDEASAEAVARACREIEVDEEQLWEQARTVGYPILPLVRQIAATLPAGPDGRVHYGATTQDIMDTALVLQFRSALDRIRELLIQLGGALADIVREHAGTVMAGRTHGMHAVPTTLGAKCAVYVGEVVGHLERVEGCRERISAVSLFGAGGTSAALGEAASDVRAAMAEALGLRAEVIPWHVARQSVAEVGVCCSFVAATVARFCREVADLSRTEISELSERTGHHRGASSTMPQKRNPISCEVAIGYAVHVSAVSASLWRASEAQHERSTGEWQVEWKAVPDLLHSCSSGLMAALDVASGLQVDAVRMRRNLELDAGLVRSEAYMMALSRHLGRETAHDLLYAAATLAREAEISLEDALERLAPEVRSTVPEWPIRPESYLGEARAICESVVDRWSGLMRAESTIQSTGDPQE